MIISKCPWEANVQALALAGIDLDEPKEVLILL
jgi:hypothetical protein